MLLTAQAGQNEDLTRMQDEIKLHLDNPGYLEFLYRNNKNQFSRAFNVVYPEIQNNPVAQAWNERLNFRQDDILWGKKDELVFVAIATVIGGLILKIPEIMGISEDFFFQRNLSFVVFPAFAAYFAWKQGLAFGQMVFPIIAFLLSATYINMLPASTTSDTLLLACIHLPIFLWGVWGYTYLGNRFNSSEKRIEFLRYNGDLAVMGGIMVIAGIVFSGITVGLFRLIQINIEEAYGRYVAVWGVAAIPIVATYLVRNNPNLVNKITPIIARIFTPLLSLTLFAFLVAVAITGKDPYNDREFLMIFNLLLVGVMAIILFSITEVARTGTRNISLFFLSALAFLTIITNLIALSAILFRIVEYGITPNRFAVLGGNALIFACLVVVSIQLFRMIRGKTDAQQVEKVIASFLPLFSVWTAFVTFFFPLIFQFK